MGVSASAAENLIKPSFPGFNNLFEFGDPLSHKPFRGKFNSTLNARSVTRGEISIEQPIKITWGMGSNIFPDVIYTTSASIIIISNRIVASFKNSEVTGWRTYEINLFDKKGSEVSGYSGLVVTGRCDTTDLSKSSVVLFQYPAMLVPRFKGTFFPPESWDGSDLFMSRKDEKDNTTSTVYVTKKVKEIFEDLKVENVIFEKLEDIEIDLSVFRIALNYKLPSDYKEKVLEAYQKAGEDIPHNLKL